MGNSWGTSGNNTSTATNVTTYDIYKLPYISTAINVNTENLQKCLQNSTTSQENQMCIQNFVSAAVKNPSKDAKLNVSFYGPGRTYEETITSVTQNQFSQHPEYPASNCYENFQKYDGDNVDYDTNIESNKIFCFNGTFTILTIFVLILLLVFINVNSKK